MTLAEHLSAIQRDDGRLLPEDVVARASDPDHPLHSFFEWDDEAAGHAHRLDQARALIRRVKVDVTVRDVPLRVPAYVRDPTMEAGESGYIATTRAAADEDRARAVVVEEMKRVSQAVRRARTLALALDCDADLETIDTLARSVATRTQEARA
jgi:hypothetical protein